MTNETVGFAFIAGLAIGFIVGSLFVMNSVMRSEKKLAQNGIREIDGVVYRITRVNP